MSARNAAMIAHIVSTEPTLIAPTFAQSANGTTPSCMEAAIERLRTCDPVGRNGGMGRYPDGVAGVVWRAYGRHYAEPAATSGQSKAVCVRQWACSHSVHGMLLTRFPYSWGFATGYDFIQNQFEAAMADDDVEMVAFDVDSYGGLAAQCEETSQMIFDARGTKPSIALVDSACLSAAYYVASAASLMYASPSAYCGSIGVLMGRADYTGMMEQVGVKVTMFSAGAYKLDTSPMVPLTPEAAARLQTTVDDCYTMFTNAVARNRSSMTVAQVKATEAGIYSAAKAVPAGLIDAVATPQDALLNAVERLGDDSDSDPQTDPDDLDPDDDDEPQNNLGASTMRVQPATQPAASTGAQPAAISQAALDAAVSSAVASAMAAARTRQTSITTCEEAKDKPKLAAHLALNTEMSVVDAQATLKAAAPETAAIVTDPLQAAMAQQGTPGVKPVGAAGGGAAEMTMTEKLLAASDKATGGRLLKAHRERVAH